MTVTDTDTPAEVDHGGRGRTPKGQLEAQIKGVCDDWMLGEFQIEGDKPLTPARIARRLSEQNGNKVSAGAVTACLKRWETYGFITTSGKPFAFEGYTEAAVTDGLQALKAQHRQRNKKDPAA